MNRAALLAAASTFILGACDQTPSASPPAQLLGLSASSTGFTMSPDGCSVAVLYDSFVRSWSENDRSSTDPATVSGVANLTLVATPTARGATLGFTVRGFYAGTNTQTGSLALTVAGQTQTVDVANTGNSENFAQDFTAALAANADGTPVELNLTLPRPPADAETYEMQMGVDSIDIKVTTAPGTKPCGSNP